MVLTKLILDMFPADLLAKYIKAMGLAGAMIWSVDTDDTLGKVKDTLI